MKPMAHLRIIGGDRNRLTLLILSLLLACSIIIPPFQEGPFSICLMKLLAGRPCPGCGMTRAFLYLGHGRISEALSLNPLSLIAYPLSVVLWVNRVVAR